jgi:hypothetical protein
MSLTEPLDEETVEAILAGDEVDPRLRRFVALAQGVRTLGDEPLPPPSPALEAVFAAGDRRNGAAHAGLGAQPVEPDPLHPSDPADPSDPSDQTAPLEDGEGGRRLHLVAKVAGLGVAAKVALGASVAAASLAIAGAGGVLPEPVTTPVRHAIEAVTPIDFGDGTAGTDGGEDSGQPGGGPGGEGSEPGSFGDRVSPDATGESDGRPGVDGGQVSDEAPGADNRPDSPGGTGLDQAEETPAEPHLPDDVGDPDDDDSDDDGPGASGSTPGATAPGSTAPGSTAPGATAPGRRTTTTTATASTASAPSGDRGHSASVR